MDKEHYEHFKEKGSEVRELFTAPQKPVTLDADMIRDANRYRFLRDEDAWGEDSDSWDAETRTGLISSENLMGGLSPDHFDDAIDARMAASDIPFLNPATAPKKTVALPSKITRGFKDLAEMYGCEPAQAEFIAVGWNAAIEAAGGIVKDGE